MVLRRDRLPRRDSSQESEGDPPGSTGAIYLIGASSETEDGKIMFSD